MPKRKKAAKRVLRDLKTGFGIYHVTLYELYETTYKTEASSMVEALDNVMKNRSHPIDRAKCMNIAADYGATVDSIPGLYAELKAKDRLKDFLDRDHEYVSGVADVVFKGAG